MICQPISACSCCDPWHMPPNSQWPLTIDWSSFLTSAGGFLGIRSVKSITLKNMNVSPPVAADEAEIALVSGYPVDPDPPPQPGFTQIINQNTATMNMIRTGPTVPVGNNYRLDIAVTSRSCEGVELVVNYCVSIIITQC